MFRRWGRLMLAFAAAFAVWAIATPARAAEAPLCDPHAATGIAPAPQLQQSQTTLEAEAPPEACEASSTAVATRFEGQRVPTPAPTGGVASEEVVATSVPRVAPAACAGSVGRGDELGSDCAGARSRVDRPPRG